jgi:hypothetical protein
MTRKLELVMLLQERALSSWERRKRRLERIPPTVAAAGLIKARKGEPLTFEEYVGANLGFLPGERERIEQMGAAQKRMGESERS